MASTIPASKSIGQLIFASALSTYGLYLSYENITRLQQFEKQSEKAAEWSNTAAQRLHKTRTTQASGTISLVVSLLTSLTLLATNYRSSPTALATASIANAGVMLATRTHMGNFWNSSIQTRIPFVEKFNDAQRGSERVVGVLGYLSASWGLAGGFGLLWGRAGWMGEWFGLFLWE